MKKLITFLLLATATLTVFPQSKFTPDEIKKRKQHREYVREKKQSIIKGGRVQNRIMPAIESVTITDTCELGMQADAFYQQNLSLDGNDLYINGQSRCFTLHDLYLRCDSATGVRLDDDQDNLFIPNYYQITFYGCDTFSVKKEKFYLETHGLECPYAYNYNTNSLINYVKLGMYGYNPSEWDTICKYGVESDYTIWSAVDSAWIPDTIMMYSFNTTTNTWEPRFIEDLDPYFDCATNVQAGFTDIYNNWFEIEDVPDGTYREEACYNLPAYIYDPGMYPNCKSRNIKKENGSIFYNVAPPTFDCCSYSFAPPRPTNVDLIQPTSTHIITWNPEPYATGYNVYRGVAYQQNGWIFEDDGTHPLVLMTPTPITTNAYHYETGAGVFYYYFISSVNCAGESLKTKCPKKVK